MSEVELVLRIVRDNPKCTSARVGEVMDLSSGDAANYLNILIKRKAIQREGKGGRKDPFRYYLPNSP